MHSTGRVFGGIFNKDSIAKIKVFNNSCCVSVSRQETKRKNFMQHTKKNLR